MGCYVHTSLVIASPVTSNTLSIHNIHVSVFFVNFEVGSLY